MRKYYPRLGQVFKDREELVDKLEKSGWEFEGQGTSFSKGGKLTGYDVGVIDKAEDKWLMVDLIPVEDGLKVTKVKRLKLSDYGKGGRIYEEQKKKDKNVKKGGS